MFLGIQHTRLGMMIRAGESDREMTKSLGINIGLVYRFIFALGVSLAAFSGMISAPISSVFPGMGSQVLIVSFVVVVIGGLGSIKGAMIAALLVGLIDTFGKVIHLDIFGVNIFPEMSGISIFTSASFSKPWNPSFVSTNVNCICCNTGPGGRPET